MRGWKVGYLRVSVEHAESVEPWRDLLAYETWVDGKPWGPAVSATNLRAGEFSDADAPSFVPGGSNIAEARGEDLLVGSCPPGNLVAGQRVAPGKHMVEIRARVPGSATTLTAGPIEVELPPCGESDASAGCSAYPSVVTQHSLYGILLCAWLLYRRSFTR